MIVVLVDTFREPLTVYSKKRIILDQAQWRLLDEDP